MSEPVAIATHYNSELEKLTIDRVTSGDFKGKHLLVIHDDFPPIGSGTRAPMLLDQGTAEWLQKQLKELFPNE